MIRLNSTFSILFGFLILFTCFSQPSFSATFNITTPADFQNALTTTENNGEDDTINVAEGHPLSGVTVSLTGDKTATTTTDINDYYYFRVENGEYFINATKENYYFRSKPKKVKIKGKNDKVNFKGKLTLASTN